MTRRSTLAEAGQEFHDAVLVLWDSLVTSLHIEVIVAILSRAIAAIRRDQR